MPKYSTTVKWGKESIEISLDPSLGVTEGLKRELQARTGVPMDRMKIMPKSKGLWKGVLKDTQDLTSLDLASITPPIQLLLMGSACLPVEPSQKIIFLEDLPPEQAAALVEPSGLINLGNTCYLNSVLQCLRVIPHLRRGLQHYSPPTTNSATSPLAQVRVLLVTSLQRTLDALDQSPQPLAPNNLVMATKMAFPQMAQTGPQGQPMQQDAEEFYSSLLQLCAGELMAVAMAFRKEAADTVDGLNGMDNVIDAVFGFKMEEVVTCDELVEEEGEPRETGEMSTTNYDLHRKLVCNIQGGSDVAANVNVTTISEGIHLALSGKLEKYSETLGRNARWTRLQRISHLPPILVVQFGRFYWKATPDSQDHAGVKCKVMKPVGFSSVLDIYEFCTDKVKNVLKVARDKAMKEEEDRVANTLRGEGILGEESKPPSDEPTQTVNDEVDDDEDNEALRVALAMSLEPEQPAVGPGLPPNFQGLYELFGVVTHKGRDADGGHYMAWVKADNVETEKGMNGKETLSHAAKKTKIADTDDDNDDWFVFDDDGVSPCKTEDILRLKGGGDWHINYLHFYRAKK